MELSGVGGGEGEERAGAKDGGHGIEPIAVCALRVRAVISARRPLFSPHPLPPADDLSGHRVAGVYALPRRSTLR